MALQDLQLFAFKEGDWSNSGTFVRVCTPVTGVLKAITWQSDAVSSADQSLTVKRNNVNVAALAIPQITDLDTDGCGVSVFPANSRITYQAGDLIGISGIGEPAADAVVYFGFTIDAQPPWNVASIYVDGPVVGTISSSFVAPAWKRGYLDRIAWNLRATHANGTAVLSIFKNAVDSGLSFDVINATVDVAGSYGVETFASNDLFIDEGDEITLSSDGGGDSDGAIDSQFMVRT